MRRALILGVLVCLTVSTVLALSVLGTKHPGGILAKVYAHEGCSLGTLTGSYGTAADGLVNPTGQPFVSTSATIPIAIMAVQSFDGAGKFSQSNTSNVGGFVFTATGSGTYTVNADCSGSATANLSNGEVIHISFVIVDDGRQILSVSADPGVISFARAIRIVNPQD